MSERLLNTVYPHEPLDVWWKPEKPTNKSKIRQKLNTQNENKSTQWYSLVWLAECAKELKWCGEEHGKWAQFLCSVQFAIWEGELTNFVWYIRLSGFLCTENANIVCVCWIFFLDKCAYRRNRRLRSQYIFFSVHYSWHLLYFHDVPVSDGLIRVPNQLFSWIGFCNVVISIRWPYGGQPSRKMVRWSLQLHRIGLTFPFWSVEHSALQLDASMHIERSVYKLASENVTRIALHTDCDVFFHPATVYVWNCSYHLAFYCAFFLFFVREKWWHFVFLMRKTLISPKTYLASKRLSVGTDSLQSHHSAIILSMRVALKMHLIARQSMALSVIHPDMSVYDANFIPVRLIHFTHVKCECRFFSPNPI